MILMRAFCNTCSAFHILKTEISTCVPENAGATVIL